ncbi:hypothetical protein J2Z69_001586 [Paenibacillus shirakamiensis]|uniref:Pilus assembly protein n=2 Tax=Paenibacillus shirakamiensis TaxID=1265935 RepID=A0ABS4JFR9_9BACL|nr:pilus assembly protein [Paenibacillus shirakamiensis]MBP2000555.1 hypothetical protein [Paenibacillus shirakamiensis]
MPVIMWILILFLFFGLYLYQTAMLQQASAVAAERAAYNWDNSHKDSKSGSVPLGIYDGLYWRLKDDSMISALFGWAGAKGGSQIPLPASPSSEDLATTKLLRIGSLVPENLKGTMDYQHQFMNRRVTVSLQRVVHLAPLERFLHRDMQQAASSSAYVVEPMEWIRNVNITRYYGAKFKQGEDGFSPQKAGQALQRFGK